MIDKTNFQMMRELMDTYGKMEHRQGFCTPEEVTIIVDTLKLKERLDIINLRNLRDFVVLLMKDVIPNRNDVVRHDKLWDEMSTITHVIDCEIVNRGGEV